MEKGEMKRESASELMVPTERGTELERMWDRGQETDGKTKE